MWPFSKKWSPPVPQLTMLVSLANQELPTLLMLANPAGIDGAVPGMAGPSDAKPTEENMTTPMQAGQFAAISPAGGACGIQVERVETQSKGLSMEPAMLEIAGLTEEMLAKFNQPTWRVIIGMEAPGEQVRDSVIFATRLAQRLA